MSGREVAEVAAKERREMHNKYAREKEIAFLIKMVVVTFFFFGFGFLVFFVFRINPCIHSIQIQQSLARSRSKDCMNLNRSSFFRRASIVLFYCHPEAPPCKHMDPHDLHLDFMELTISGMDWTIFTLWRRLPSLRQP